LRSEQLDGVANSPLAVRAILSSLRAAHLAETREAIASIVIDQIVAGNPDAHIAVGINAGDLRIYSETLTKEPLTFPIFVFGHRVGDIEWTERRPLRGHIIVR
jgi:hypothetical protein